VSAIPDAIYEKEYALQREIEYEVYGFIVYG
jgi:hypothetical protein